MRVRIQVQKKLKNSVYYGGCNKSQRYWWVRDITRNCWVDLGNQYISGNESLDTTADILPGVYHVGCGPRGTRGICEMFELLFDDAGKMGFVYNEKKGLEIGGAE